MKKAFTLLELIFVILIIGILTSLSSSFINITKDEVKILKLKTDYEMLNSALTLMRTQMQLKNLDFPSILDHARINHAREKLFYCNDCGYSLLDTPIYSDFKFWMKIDKNHYSFFLNSKESIKFVYDPKEGLFKCLESFRCKDLI
ncbi:prepilin-type N-terminal cleavage/methylation domain-containing protein [Campylobacter hepaticus]|uniref:Prepilin-type N-terminal cleavage/methylation domain-containing protein n=1 Tax=Campylobacter hepaticus TaxID=1813019 RepID=A0A424Z019_9BACT|nr:prepilin-type N-terminal cleavage/methylation domain-containing protein [Campylobacter hepaticus]AXP08733.1 prepilin-type N-terminal cleavage/methylation domain-containing protein [Campylobacter hepaticus]MCZ0772580.1 prepilin-type N-terminal cleavage/methylation domain-containing protein [Campylobacter hepaticus]MCZ0774048.1 prepilin-type N-terminal cleavage/methylation domain-containing protein [Campylobacter hepaticus]MCZ0775300.1 prepilin-type N-terminal cleavage/methylation domain-conta